MRGQQWKSKFNIDQTLRACASNKVQKCSVLNSMKTVAALAPDLDVKFWTVQKVEVLPVRKTHALKMEVHECPKCKCLRRSPTNEEDMHTKKLTLCVEVLPKWWTCARRLQKQASKSRMSARL